MELATGYGKAVAASAGIGVITDWRGACKIERKTPAARLAQRTRAVACAMFPGPTAQRGPKSRVNLS
jgi:hypothetical protein